MIILGWLPSLLCYWFTWPIIQQKRRYLIIATILCFTPMVSFYSFSHHAFTPLVLSLSVWFYFWLQGGIVGFFIAAIMYGYMFPFILMIGVSAWILSSPVKEYGEDFPISAMYLYPLACLVPAIFMALGRFYAFMNWDHSLLAPVAITLIMYPLHMLVRYLLRLAGKLPDRPQQDHPDK